MCEAALQTAEGSVPRAFAVLELLALALAPMRLSAVALQLGMQKSTVHRVLTTLSGLQQLHQTTRETVSLTILSGDDVLYLDKLISPRPIRFTSRVGSRAPAPLTAGGKAILAHEPDARAIIRRVRARVQDKQRLNPETLLAELVGVRNNGYATSSFRPGVLSFGAPIMARDGRAAAALSVSAPQSRLTKAKQQDIVEQLLRACAEIAERVGHL